MVLYREKQSAPATYLQPVLPLLPTVLFTYGASHSGHLSLIGKVERITQQTILRYFLSPHPVQWPERFPEISDHHRNPTSPSRPKPHFAWWFLPSSIPKSQGATLAARFRHPRPGPPGNDPGRAIAPGHFGEFLWWSGGCLRLPIPTAYAWSKGLPAMHGADPPRGIGMGKDGLSIRSAPPCGKKMDWR